jgi:hypothetical protein
MSVFKFSHHIVFPSDCTNTVKYKSGMIGEAWVTSQGIRQSRCLNAHPYIWILKWSVFRTSLFSIIFVPNTQAQGRKRLLFQIKVSHILKCKSYCLLNYRQLSKQVLGSRNWTVWCKKDSSPFMFIKWVGTVYMQIAITTAFTIWVIEQQ